MNLICRKLRSAKPALIAHFNGFVYNVKPQETKRCFLRFFLCGVFVLFAGSVNAEILCINKFIYRNKLVTAFGKNLQNLPQRFRRIFYIVMEQ